MKLLMISGDRSVLQGKKGAFWYTLEEFSKHWERIDVICPKSSPTPNPSPVGGGDGGGGNFSKVLFSKVHLHSSTRNLWYQSWFILQRGTELFEQHHHDVMTVHEYPPFYNGLGAKWLHRSTKIPYAIEIHHIVGWPQPSSLSESIGLRLSKWYLPREARYATAVRTVNENVKQELTSFGIDSQKISVVPSFYLDRHVLQQDSSSIKKFDVVFCGRLVANKGLMEVLDAIGGLPNVSLLVIGDGPMRESAEQKAKTFGNRVHFTGWLPTQEEVVKQLQTAKIFVMNSKSEGGPRVTLEAMALGMPVISTKVGVMPSVIQDGVNGIFTTGEPKDLAEKISYLLSKEALRMHMGEAATKILEKYDRSKLIREYAEFLQDLPSRQ